MTDSFNGLLFDFVEHLKVRNYSPKSVSAYSQHLQGLFDYFRGIHITGVKEVTREILKAYQIKITEEGGKRCDHYSTATISVKIRAIKRFCEYLEDSNRILINPAEYLREPARGSTLPATVLTEEEAKKVLEAPNLSTLTGIRDRAVLEIFYSTGIRLEEMVSLTIYDCDLQGGFLRVNKGKGAKDRVIPLGRHAVKFLREYLTKIRPQLTKTNKTIRNLFVNRMGEPLSKQIIEIGVRNYGKQAGLTKKVTPHLFRHAFATQLVKNGADITAVQKMLGHSSLRVTQIYVRVAGVEVKKTHSAHHPREKDKAVKEEITPQIRGRFRRDRH